MDGQKINSKEETSKRLEKQFFKIQSALVSLSVGNSAQGSAFWWKVFAGLFFPPAPFYASDGPMHSTPMGKDFKDFSRRKARILQN